MATCSNCKGTRRCQHCGGTGDGKSDPHPSSWNVNPDTGAVKCFVCKGTGKCVQCDGIGEEED